MSESPEKKTIKRIIPHLEKKVLKSKEEYFGVIEIIMAQIEKSRDIRFKTVWTNALSYAMRTFEDYNFYIQTLETLTSEYDQTFIKIFEEANREYKEQINQKEEEIKKMLKSSELYKTI
ncbi:MAG: hypothetical protein L6N96_05280 [Candidatus Methylarchaceae archaeon HK02M2]|nr:hypothetical protein [Candidatus Methylarchaceae archaeon HK02M2]